MMKMYILIKDSLPVGFAVLTAAHASLAAYLRFKDSKEISEWLSGPFYKVVCKVNDKEFELAKTCTDNIVLAESALNNQEVAIVFKPRDQWPEMFRFFKLYK